MNWSFTQKLLFLTALVIIVLVGWYWSHPLGTKLTIGDHTFKVELAVTPAEKQQGLGNRDSLSPDGGMLFVYDHSEQYGFWMKGMRFPLDFIWIGGDTVVDITKNVPNPATDTSPLLSYQPSIPVDKILEVNAGTVDRLGIHAGDKVLIHTN